jgi:2-phospho-L-lactate guanylyltransferase (CobY/MobA/RfbA family)
MSLPTAPRFAFAYGPGSRQLHLDAARAAGLSAEEHPDEALGWDVDEAADLSPPGSLGVLPLPPSGCASAARR